MTSTLPLAGSRPRRAPSRRSGACCRPGLDYENHTSHPAPGHLAIYPGGISECEIFFPYGGCTTASKVGPLAANHFASVVADEGWDDRLREMGRRCLWEGAQSISIREVE